ncbi:flagellar M-ring protein FliF [Roseivivax marinus]|uniref:flagellar basal-body MS-ring/collar protein FliF n=1 Tax=Roseivivax marinus TaxID=1379903 RepID=UPI001F03C5E2|nr:flagellar basal-body MS-ring/collar protein FliF [Roseivivax marinus]UMA64336.1 flagellar M-ring protein FliF [Roseivivax marinus]
MQQLLSVWNALSLTRKVVVTGATVLMFAALILMSRLAATPDLTLLYAGLEGAESGEVVAALERRGVPYEVRGGAIFVPAADRDALRMTLAGEGLPANGAGGYELLDGLSGFGTTSQMFDAAYWRAKEGELARTILAAPYVTAVRVHIAAGTANPFQRDVEASASVSVTGAGGAIDTGQARAIRYLVASAVPGLAPEDVTVVDSRAGLIGAEEEGVGPSAEDRTSALRDRVQRLVEARVGMGNAVVEVSLDTITESEQIRERRFDPESRIVISSDTEERQEQSEDQGGGDVTVASNLPDGAAGGGSETSKSSESSTRERLNYEVSETTREVVRAPGAIRRLSVAVLVNGTLEPGPDGAPQFVPLADAEQEALRDLVASAVGYDEARGDTITIRSLPFEQAEGLGTAATEPGMFAPLRLDPMSLIQLAVLGIVALALGLFVVRPVLAGGAAAALPAPGADDDLEMPAFGMANALSGEIDDDTGGGFGGLPMLADGGGFELPGESGGGSEDPVERLRGLIDDRREEAVQILRSWLDTPEEVE